jgi:Zn-dependent peptidase ImmA (M78 family)/transcriptional regulator with XRE-family HTH domain
MTQEALASAIGTTQAALSRYENDLREPDPETLDALAAALGITADFLQDASDIKGAALVTAHMRRRASAAPGEWKRMEARLNMHRLHARRVFEQIVVRSSQRVPSFSPFDTNPEHAAVMLRMQWHMPAGPVRGLIRWIEAAGCIVIEEDFGTPRIDGLSQWIDEVPIIVVNITVPTDRKRLTLAHELGHLCLHSDDVAEEAEDQANAFAAEFLMPATEIKPQLRNLTLGRLLDLKREWQTSMQALIERAYQLKTVSASQRTNLYKMLSKRRWRVDEPLRDVLRPEVPAMPDQIGAAMVATGLGREEVAIMLGYAKSREGVPFMPASRLRAL